MAMDMQGDFNDSAKKRPGEMFREFLGAAADDENNEAIKSHQVSDKVNGFFLDVADMSMMAARQLMMQMKALEQQLQAQGVDDEEKTQILISQRAHGFELPAITMMPDPDLAGIQFTAESLMEIPGYKRLHAVARALDVAVNVGGISDGYGESAQPLKLQLDICKSYAQGKEAHPEYYPELPEQPQPGEEQQAAPQEDHSKITKRPPKGKFDM